MFLHKHVSFKRVFLVSFVFSALLLSVAGMVAAQPGSTPPGGNVDAHFDSVWSGPTAPSGVVSGSVLAETVVSTPVVSNEGPTSGPTDPLTLQDDTSIDFGNITENVFTINTDTASPKYSGLSNPVGNIYLDDSVFFDRTALDGRDMIIDGNVFGIMGGPGDPQFTFLSLIDAFDGIGSRQLGPDTAPLRVIDDSGLSIQNIAGTIGLLISGTGVISNPGPNNGGSVTISDADGASVQSGTWNVNSTFDVQGRLANNSGTIYGGVMAVDDLQGFGVWPGSSYPGYTSQPAFKVYPNGSIGSPGLVCGNPPTCSFFVNIPLKIADNNGVEFADDAGNTGLKVAATGDLSNPGANYSGRVRVSDDIIQDAGYGIYTDYVRGEVYNSGTGTTQTTNLSLAGFPSVAVSGDLILNDPIFASGTPSGSVEIKDPQGLQMVNYTTGVKSLNITQNGELGDLSANPVTIRDDQGFQVKNTFGTQTGLTVTPSGNMALSGSLTSSGTISSSGSSYGVNSGGSVMGGYLQDTNSSGYAYVGYGDAGIQAYGNSWGGYFRDTNNTGYAYVGYGDRGIFGYGSFTGGTFQNTSSGYWADIGTSSYSMVTNGGLYIQSTATYRPGGGSWLSTSDARLKDVHGNYDKGLDDIVQLNPVIFNYKADNPLGLPADEEYIGFIAQEVKKIFPEAITEGEEGYLTFDMHPITVSIVNAIQELKGEKDQEIADLKAEVAELKVVICELKPESVVCRN